MRNKIQNQKHKSKVTKEVISNVENLSNSTKAVTDFFIDYTKQMLQRLPIALAQIKAGNNSKSLLNEIRQIVYSLYQSK